MQETQVSRTAVFVCQGRAVADGLVAAEAFADPFAARVLRADELTDVELGRLEAPPRRAGERLRWERMRAVAAVVVPRTVAIDEAVTTAGNPQLVIVGAGLDCRPWRLSDSTRVFSVDHPTTQADARRRAAALPRLDHLTWVPVDLAAGSLATALVEAGHDPALPTTWVWEGVVPYLTPPQVAATLEEITAVSSAGSVLIVNYQSPSLTARVGRLLARAMSRLAGQRDPLVDERWRSLWRPDRLAVVLARNGFVVERDDDLLTVARRIGSPTARARTLQNGRLAVAVVGSTSAGSQR